jgi:tetratricopeptide (TPR) repeat protein
MTTGAGHSAAPFNFGEIERLIHAGETADARDRCLGALDAGHEDARLWLLLAACRQRLAQPDEARAALRRAAEMTASPALLEQIADALLKLRDYPLASQVIERLDFSHPNAVLLQARCRWGLGRHRGAIEQLDALARILPDWPQLALSHARMLVNLGLHRQALDRVETALAAHRQERTLAHQKALLLLTLEGADTAREWLAAGRSLPAPLETLADALGIVAGRANAATQRAGPQWEGFMALLDAPGKPDWFGDNVALLQRALAHAPDSGAVVECGVYHGRTLTLLAQWAAGRKVHGFDSFQGLPEAWSALEPAGSYSTGGRSPSVPDNVELVPGWFADTLPEFAATLDAPIAFLHIDCDLYQSTREVLAALGPSLQPGSVVVFDEYTGYPGWRGHEFRAWQEYLAASSTEARLIGGQLLGQSAAFRVTATEGAHR